MKNNTRTDEVCTTQRAAEILGVSVSTVQQLVEGGAIRAWKTTGGHRRIPLSEVLAYKNKPNGTTHARAASVETRPSVLVVEDNHMQRQIYAAALDNWCMHSTITFCENGYQALIELTRKPPDILLVDIMMDGIDGFELIKTILCDEHLNTMDIAILSGISREELQIRGGASCRRGIFR